MAAFPAVVDLLTAGDSLRDYWLPKVVARVNDQYGDEAALLSERQRGYTAGDYASHLRRFRRLPNRTSRSIHKRLS